MTEPTPQHPERPDPFLEEVRALKRAAAEEAGGDAGKLGEQLREIERRFAERVVQPPREGDNEAA